MPDRDSHLAVARRNQALIDHLIATPDGHPEWVSVVAFYKALHLVDAMLYADHPDRHGGSHDSREGILKRTNRYGNVYKHYRPLFAASLIARYLETGRTSYRSFSDYLSKDEVTATLINHHLRQLERTVEKLTGPIDPPPPTLPTGS